MRVGQFILAIVVGTAAMFLIILTSQAEIMVSERPSVYNSISVESCNFRKLIEKNLALGVKEYETDKGASYLIESRMFQTRSATIKIDNCKLNSAEKEEWRGYRDDGSIYSNSLYKFFLAREMSIAIDMGRSPDGYQMILPINAEIRLNLSGFARDLQEELYQTLGSVNLKGAMRILSYSRDNKLFFLKPGDIDHILIYIEPDVLNGHKPRN